MVKKLLDIICDILNIILLRIKLLLSNKLLIVMLGIYIIISTIIISTFFVASKDNSKIPIGIVDMDNTSHSKYIIDNLNKTPLIRVTIGEKNSLIDKVKDGELNAVFVLKKNIGSNIENGYYDKIIDAYYTSNEKYARLLSDVVLSSMLDDICFNYAKSIYYKNKNKLDTVYTEEEYKNRISEQYSEQEKTIGFDFDVVNVSKDVSVNNKIDTNLLYRQIVIGVIALVIMVMCLLMGNIILDDYKYKVILRRTTTNVSNVASIIGDTLGIGIIVNTIAIVQGLLLMNKTNLNSIEQKMKFLLIITLFVGTISMIFVFITRVINEIITYQLVGSIVMLILGISGALYILGFLINNAVIGVTKYSPMGNLINTYKNITLNNSIKNNIIGYVFTIIVIYILTYYIQKAKGDRINGES